MKMIFKQMREDHYISLHNFLLASSSRDLPNTYIQEMVIVAFIMMLLLLIENGFDRIDIVRQ